MPIEFADFIHGRAPTSAGPLHYREGGAGEPVLMLHGWPQHSLQWHKVAPLLAERYRVIALDLPGCGGSPIPRDGRYDKRSLAEIVSEFVDKLDLESVRLVGYDHGGGVAYNYACLAPDKVKQLAICEYVLPGCGYEKAMLPAPEWHTGSNWQLALFTVPDVAEFAFRGRERELFNWFVWHGSFNPFAISNDHVQQYVDAIARPGALRAGIELYAAVWQDMEQNQKNMQTKLKMPVIGIGGRANAGEFVGRSLAAVAENAQVAVVERAGHWLSDENPDGLATALLDFFNA